MLLSTVVAVVARVLARAQQHRDEHPGEHRDVLDEHQRANVGARGRLRPERPHVAPARRGRSHPCPWPRASLLLTHRRAPPRLAAVAMATTHPAHSALSALYGAPTWLNTEPLTADALRGHVVLVDVWTYSCVNWLRTLPYVRAWADRYRERGLVVVGVHSPEFGFEHDLDNVRRAVGELDVGYPVVLDNDFAIWRSLGNRFWPAIYLVDQDGRVRFTHFGEGNYEETEHAIQRLLGVDEAT